MSGQSGLGEFNLWQSNMSASNPRAIAAIEFCNPAPSTQPDWSRCVTSARQSTNVSPVDQFYERHRALRTLNIHAGGAASSDSLLRELLLLGFVSATELYFRQLLSRTVRICSRTRARAAQDSISFAALDYYPPDALEAALTERTSFTEEKALAGYLSKYWDIKLDVHPDLKASVSNFLGVRQLRHAIVHSAGHMTSRNATDIAAGAKHVVVQIDATALDQAAGVCLDLVRTVNNEVGRATLWGWIQAQLISGSWAADRPRYALLLDVFESRTDKAKATRAGRLGAVHSAAKVAADQWAQAQVAKVTKASAKPS